MASDSLETRFDNWLHDNAPAREVYEDSEFVDTWTGHEVRVAMWRAFVAGCEFGTRGASSG